MKPDPPPAPPAKAAAAAAVGERSRAELVAELEAKGYAGDLACQYVDAFLEYREASTNIHTFGTIVQHPRTASPIENPYLRIRDRALAKLRKMRMVKAGWSWV